MENKIKVVVVEPNKEPYVKEIENTLEGAQKVVGGYIQTVGWYHPLVLVCNEEGKLMGLPFNRRAKHDVLVGTFFLTKSGDDGDFISLNDEDVKKAISLFTLEEMNYKEVEPIMNKLFPRLKDFPINSMTPSLSKDEDENIVVSMLILGDDDTIQDFVADKTGRVDIQTTTYTEKNENGMGKDLVIRLDFFYPTGHPIFETVIYGDLLERQKDFIEALTRVNEFVVWVVNKNHEVVKIMEVSWNYLQAKRTLDEFGR